MTINKNLITFNGVEQQNRESLLDEIADQMIKPYKEPVITITKKQSTKEMFEKMTKFFFKSFCNCKK